MLSAAKHIGVTHKTIYNIFTKGKSYDNLIYKFKIKDIRVWIYDSKNKLVNILGNTLKTSIYYNIPNTTLHSYIKSGRLSIYYSKKAMLSKLSTRISIVYSAILKHDYYNFSLEILEYCDLDVLIKREQYYIDLLKPEYNIINIANSRLGSKQSEETKTKISISNKGKHKY